MDSNSQFMQFKHQQKLQREEPGATTFEQAKLSASSATHRSWRSATNSLMLEGGGSRSSKKTGGTTTSANGELRQHTSNAHGQLHPSVSPQQYINQHNNNIPQHSVAAMADQRIQSTSNKNQNNNLHRNSKNRKLYTSIGAYSQSSKQAFMASGGLPHGIAGGVAGAGQNTHGSVGSQPHQLGQSGAQAGLARNIGNPAQGIMANQQRNIVLSQQQSLANKPVFFPENDGQDLKSQQVQHLLSHQISLNQSNHNNLQAMAHQSEQRASKGAKDRVAPKKGANSSVLVVQSRDLMLGDDGQAQQQYQQQNNRPNNITNNQMDSSQISMISRGAPDGVLKDNHALAQIAAYQSAMQQAEQSHLQSNFHDFSVLSGPEHSTGNQSFNTALIINQRGLTNMSQIVPTSTSTQLNGTGGQGHSIQKYKNAHILHGFNTQQQPGQQRESSQLPGQATHNSVIIEKNSSSEKGVKQVKRNTLVKINNQGLKQNNFTQIGNYVESQSKEYLENSFHEAKSISRALANQSEIQKSQSTSMGQGKLGKSKLLTIGSSNKVSKHATVGAVENQGAQQLAQNQVNFISNFQIEENHNAAQARSNGSATNAQSNSKHGGLAKNQQNYILLQQQNSSLMQKQRPHSSFKAQTQKQINTFKQQLVNLNGAQTQQPTTATGPAPGQMASGKGQVGVNGSAQAHTSGRRAAQQNQQQQLLIGADGVVGFGGIGSAGSLAQGKTVGSRKNKHLAQQVNLNKAGKNILIGKTQKLNQMSVYQNQMVSEVNHREPRRIGRGGSGIDASGLGVRNELSNITKEHREMRTSSAAAGNTNTEFKLMNLTGTTVQGHSGNALNNGGAGGLFNLNNHNQNYQVNGPGAGGTSASHMMSGISAISGHSGGAASTHTAVLTIPSNKAATQAHSNHVVFNATTGSHKASTSSKVANGKNKSSKRNIAAAANSGVPSFPIENILSSTNKSLISASNTEQMMLFQNIDSIRSGDGGLANRGSVLGAAGTMGLMNTVSKNPAGYGINLHPAKMYDQDQRQNFNKSATGGAVRTSSKASKGSVRQSILSGNGAPSKPADNANLVNQCNKAHQQSMQKFLQQQMTMYNISQNPQRAGPASFNSSVPKASKRVPGLAGISSGSTSKQSTSKQREGQVMNYYNSNLQNFQHMPNNSQIQAQGYQGQSVSQGQAQPQGQGSGGGKGLKSSAQKLTKKQIQQQNLLASDRLRGVQHQRDNKEAFRKGGTQTAIGTGAGPNKSGVLASNQLQVQRPSTQKNQSQSLSRSRVTSQNRQQQIANANSRLQQQPPSGASSVQGNKKGIKALSSIPGHPPTVGALGSMSATPGILGNQKINLVHHEAAHTAAMATHQRNFYSQAQRSNNSTRPRFDAYKAAQTGGASGRAAPSGHQEGATNAATISSTAAPLPHERHGSNLEADHMMRASNQHTVDAFELTQQQLRQIQIAESAVNEMKVALNQHKADTLPGNVVMVAGEGSTEKQQQSQQRPRSQNDVHYNFVHMDGMDSDGLAEMMAMVPPRDGELAENATGPLDAMSYQSKQQDIASGAFAAAENQQSRLWSQERPLKAHEEDHAVTGSLEFVHAGFSDTQGANSTFIEKHEGKHVDNADDEIDKEQFLIIVANAFEKIIVSMHPRIGNNLKHIRNMYTHFIEQVEANHHQQLQENAVRIQDFQATLADVQVQNQSLQLQISQKVALHEEKQVQLSVLASKNKDLQTQAQKAQEEARVVKANFTKLKDNYEKQRKQIDHFKNNIEDARSVQNQHAGADRSNVGLSVIQQMKQSFAQDNQRDQPTGNKKMPKELNMQKLKEMNERTKEVRDSLDQGPFGQDDESSIMGGLPDFDRGDIVDDPLDLDGDIGQIGKLNFGKNHVRIANGDIRQVDDAMPKDQDTGRMADRFSRDRVESRLGHRAKKSRRGPNDDLTEDEVAEVELSSIPSYDINDMGKMQHGEQQRIQDEMIADMQFDDVGNIDGELGRNPEEAESYFSSRIHSSSETINSEVIMAYQKAIQMNGGQLPPDNQLPPPMRQAKGKNAGPSHKNSRGVIEQDASSAAPPNKIRVPALDFNILQHNLAYEANQEVGPLLIDDNQELQDLVDAADSMDHLDLQDLNSFQDQEDQNESPPQAQNQMIKQKMNMPIMSMMNKKGSAPPLLIKNEMDQHMSGSQGISQANETGGATNLTKIATMGSRGAPGGMSLGFSIDLTKLKGKPGADGNDHNGMENDDNQNNDYQLEGVPKPADFQDEFMAKYDEFSESWRMMLRKQKRF